MPGFRTLYEIWRRDNSLNLALNDCLNMLAKTHVMFRDSVSRLRTQEPTAGKLDIYAEDRIINEFQMAVRSSVVKYLAVTGSVHLVPGLVLTSIVIDIERIGDYTKNITELALAYPHKLAFGRNEERVREIEDAVERMFEGVRPIVGSSNQEAARTLIENCFWIRESSDRILDELVRGEDASMEPNQSAAIALYIRYLKRIGAHLLNILSSVVNPFERIGYR